MHVEKIYYDKENYITIGLPAWRSIGCFMSGGADSSLMAYIIAKIISDNKLPIKAFPITGEFLARPFNLRCVVDVCSKIEELTGFKFEQPLNFIIPNFDNPVSDDQKIQLMSQYTTSYQVHFNLEFLYNGLTANPPWDFVKNTKFAHRQPCRDDLEWRIEQESKPGLKVPFIHVDKKVIGTLYRKFGIIDSILPLTRSCEAEMDETNYFTKDCFDVRPVGEECWWCLERQYGVQTSLQG